MNLRVVPSALRRRAGRARTNADGPPRWVSGALAGVQAALLSLLVVVVPGVAAYVATSGDPAVADVGWTQAAAVGTGVWLLGHGGMLQAQDVLVTLVPLGVALLGVVACYASARRSAHPERSAWASGTASYTALVLAATLLAGDAGPLGSGPLAVVRALVGAALVAAVGLGLGTGRLLPAVHAGLAGLPRVVRVGSGAAAVAVAALVAAGAATTVWWVLAGRAAAGDVIDGLQPDPLGGAVLAAAQLLLLPNLLVWAVAWLAGPGFAVGAGTSWTSAEVVAAPLPAVPLLGALPADGGYPWAPLPVLAAGLAAGWYVHRGLRATRPWESLAAVTVATLGAVGAVLLAQVAAGGSAGPGRMAVVGADPVAVALAVAGLVGAAALLTAVPADAVVRAWVARASRSAWASSLGRPRAARPSVAAEEAVDA